ncbi:MAG: DoxX family protein [Bacteroidota bacterium]
MQTPLTSNLASLLLRLGFGLYLLLGHGWSKVIKLFSGGEIQFTDLFGLSPELNLGFTAFAEAFCALMVVIGFRTRLFVWPIILVMFVIVAFVKVDAGWVGSNSRELAMMYLIPFIAIFILGSGKYSVDHLLESRKIV